ncbi:MAG: Na+ dependent nucleoside transporter N-terminal domain-containing protein [Chromatiales bacterium]
MLFAQGLLGIAVIIGLAWAVSENRRAVSWRTVLAGLALQIVLTAILLEAGAFKTFFIALNDLVG